MKTVLIYKQVSGFETYVKVRNRWYWVTPNGGNRADLNLFNAEAAKAEVSLERQLRLPTPISNAYKKYGTTYNVVMRAIPQWTKEVGF